VRFDKFDAIFNVKMGIQECLYEMHAKKRMVDVLEGDDKNYVERMMRPVDFGAKIIEKYNDTTSIHIVPDKLQE
jgi:hypothetical protein